MTLPSSPPIAASQIRNELGLSDFKMNRASERSLAGKLSGGYSFLEFLGKSSTPRVLNLESRYVEVPYNGSGPITTYSVNSSGEIQVNTYYQSGGVPNIYRTFPWADISKIDKTACRYRKRSNQLEGGIGEWSPYQECGSGAVSWTITDSFWFGVIDIQFQIEGTDLGTKMIYHDFVHRPIQWTGSSTNNIGNTLATTTILAIQADGTVEWGYSTPVSGNGGLLGYWTTAPVNNVDMVEIRYILKSGPPVSGFAEGQWRNMGLNSPTPLTLTKTSGSPSTVTIQIRRWGGGIEAEWDVTLITVG